MAGFDLWIRARTPHPREMSRGMSRLHLGLQYRFGESLRTLRHLATQRRRDGRANHPKITGSGIGPAHQVASGRHRPLTPSAQNNRAHRDRSAALPDDCFHHQGTGRARKHQHHDALHAPVPRGQGKCDSAAEPSSKRRAGWRRRESKPIPRRSVSKSLAAFRQLRQANPSNLTRAQEASQRVSKRLPVTLSQRP